MSNRSLDQQRTYPPDYVSAETLAYRLDCSRSTIDTLVREGLLPQPEVIGSLRRWDFGRVKAFIKARNESDRGNPADGFASEEDAYVKGLSRGSPKKGGR